SMSHGFALALQPDGKVLLAGRAMGDSVFDMAVARFDASGVLDASFGSGGKARIAIGAHAQARTVLVQPDGKIVLVGPEAVGRLTSNGQIDNSFGVSGVVNGKGGWAAFLETGGKIVMAGQTPDVPGQPNAIDFRLYR